MNHEDALGTIRSMLKCENINIEKLIKKKESILYIVSAYPENNSNRACIKFYFDLEKNSVNNEYINLEIFYSLTKGRLISAPRPLAFDATKGAIAYEFVEGTSLKDFLFNPENDKNDFENILKFTAESLSEFHKIFEVEDDASIDLKGHPKIEDLFRTCALKRFVRPFLDFKPENIIVSSEGANKKIKISLIDFPNKYNFYGKDNLSLPHRDLAYFLYHMMRIGGYPHFSIFKKYGWNNKKVIGLFLNAYFEGRAVECKDEDIYIINYFFNNYAAQWARAPYKYVLGTTDKLRSLCLKYYSPLLINIIIKSFDLPEKLICPDI